MSIEAIGASKPQALANTMTTGNPEEAFRHLRWTALVNTVRGKLAGNRLRLALIVFFSFVFWAGLYVIFHDGFAFLRHHHLLAGPLLEMLFRLFFASLLVMLFFSTGIILFASLFASREAEYLLALPVQADQVFGFKFQEAMFFSSWGFVLLGSPLMIAYGVTAKAPPVYYLMVAMYFLSYAVLPASLGAIACLLITNFFPRRKLGALVALGILTLSAAAILGWRVWNATRGGVNSRAWINHLLSEVNVGKLSFLPSDWISRGVLAATVDGGLFDSLFYLAVLMSNSLFAYLIAAWGFHQAYRRGYNRVHSDSLTKRKRAAANSLAIIDAPLFFLPRTVRVLLAKDLRVFVRDPVQWSQVLIFSGLLVFYFLNLGRMTYYTTSPYWRNLIGFFNLAVTGLLLATYTSRFIFPLLSLEGQKFWILGLAPVSRDTVLWSKFAFSAGGATLVTFTLTLLGAYMLGLEPFFLALHLGTMLVLSLGVSAIAVGLGACFPEMKQTDPSKIAAGFGGTLNLVASLCFIVLVIALLAFPCHLYAVTETVAQGSADLALLGPKPKGLGVESFRFWMGMSVAAALLIGAGAIYAPMKLGIRAFRRMEF